jgi:tetratricopeptide (TPR) repeat protein
VLPLISAHKNQFWIQVLKEDGANAREHFLGIVHQPELSETRWHKLLALKGHEKDALINLVRHLGNAFLYWENDPANAREIFKLGGRLGPILAVAFNPTSSAYMGVLCELWSSKVTPGAIEELKSATNTHWNRLDRWFRADRCNALGAALHAAGRLDDARRWLERALSALPHDSQGPGLAVLEAHIRSNLARALLSYELNQAIDQVSKAMIIITERVPPRGVHFREETIFHVYTTWIIVAGIKGSNDKTYLERLRASALKGVHHVYGQYEHLVKKYQDILRFLKEASHSEQRTAAMIYAATVIP